MNINSILNSTRPISLYEKEKDTRDTSFMDILAQTAKEAVSAQPQVTEYTVSSEEIQAVADDTDNEASDEPRYTFTDEEAEYFREKYGENYDEDTAGDFFKELADEGIISYPDAISSLCCVCICRIEIIGPPGIEDPFSWAATPLGADPVEWRKTHPIETKILSMGRARPRNIFEKEYEEFRQEYTKEVTTWEDFLQEQLDFYEYLKNRDTIYDSDGNPRPNDSDYSGRMAMTERVAEVLKQLYTQQSSGGDI